MISDNHVNAVLGALRDLCGAQGEWAGGSLTVQVERRTGLPKSTVLDALIVLVSLKVLFGPLALTRQQQIARFGDVRAWSKMCRWELQMPEVRVQYVQPNPNRTGYFVLADATPDH
jgi:hypothetical protein